MDVFCNPLNIDCNGAVLLNDGLTVVVCMEAPAKER